LDDAPHAHLPFERSF